MSSISLTIESKAHRTLPEVNSKNIFFIISSFERKKREMKGHRSIRQNPLWDWDGIFDNIISRYLGEWMKWARNGEGVVVGALEITSWNDGLQTKIQV